MAATQKSQTNGVNGHANGVATTTFTRFAHVPPAIDIPVRAGDIEDEAVNLDLTDLGVDNIDELCDLLENENVARNFWVTIAMAYAKEKKVDTAIDIVRKGIDALKGPQLEDRTLLFSCLSWLQLSKARHAPRVRPENSTDDVNIKDYWMQQATTTLNEASKLNPANPSLALARGVLNLLSAALQTGRSAATATGALAEAAKCFEITLRASKNQNVMALVGKAKAVYSLGKYTDALQLYQQSLDKAPHLLNPDPRIGIGCCLWQLGHKDHARSAWERSLELNPQSSIAHTLLGLYYLDQSSQYATNDDAFKPLYQKAMTAHTQTAFKLNDSQPLTCSTFGGYFLLRKAWPNLEKLAKRAVEQTDITAIASDGWYLRARQAHYQNDLSVASDCYNKSDQARGGEEKGYLPAKFGVAQLRVLMNDLDGAKFRLDKPANQNKSVEAMTLLGMLLADDVFAKQAAGSKDDRGTDKKRATALLDQVRAAWRDPKRKISPDTTVLLTLARLYETESTDRSLSCLQQVEQIEIDEIPEEDKPEGDRTKPEYQRSVRELISPQLLNNIGCFQFHAEKYSQAREDFQTALSACVKMGDKEEGIDTDALVTTISFNLARTYEAENLDDEAMKVYTSLLQRHPDYIDANLRLSYISLNSDPAAGAAAIKQLLEANPNNLEVRSLYGWFINKNKKRTLALNEDQEQRHYKQTLQTHDKHDLYALTGMGNLHLATAREMPRTTDQEKEKRSKIYQRAVEFFDKVLLLDPFNAFAAQGMGIALVEDRKDIQNAIQVFSKARESIRDFSVHLNLGHIFAEVKQYSRSIENYELALAKMRSTDPQQPILLGCLGRAWLLRGRAEKLDSKLEAFKTSLAYSQRALEITKGHRDEISYRFNVAYMQIQVAQLLNQLPEAQRTLADVETASKGLDEAIEAFTEIAKSPQPPFPRHDLEQRANMGRNTMKRQLGVAIERQAEYERKNASRLESARKLREEEIRKREEEKCKAEEAAAAQKAKLAEERQKLQEEDRLLIERRMDEEKVREEAEYTTDEATGERKKREKRPKGEKRTKRKKKGDESDSDAGLFGEGTDGDEGGAKKSRKSKGRAARSSATPGSGSDGEAPRKKKKRKLERKGAAAAKPSKFKSSEMVEESDDEAGAAGPSSQAPAGSADEDVADTAMADADEGVSRASQRKKAARVLDDDEDEDEGEGGDVAAAGDEDDG